MQEDFHYYATYCAAILAGFSHEDSMSICRSAQFTDCCSETLLRKVGAPLSAATTQLPGELIDSRTDIIGLQKITRIWASFHFLPGDLYRPVSHVSAFYKSKFRMICNVNSALLKETVEQAKGSSLQAAGIAMHVLADTWAHRYFAGTPSLVINNTNYFFYEIIPVSDIPEEDHTAGLSEAGLPDVRISSADIPTVEIPAVDLPAGKISARKISALRASDGKFSSRKVSAQKVSARKVSAQKLSAVKSGKTADYVERQVRFHHSPTSPDDIGAGYYTATMYRGSENSIMNLGHGRAGHLPDYSFARYRYLPAWADCEEFIKDNPTEYLLAFRQMVYALKFLRGAFDTFELEHYDTVSVNPLEEEIRRILEIRRPSASEDWKALGERLSGHVIEPFRQDDLEEEYLNSPEYRRDETELGSFILAAMRQKSMVTNRIFASGNLSAGISVEYKGKRIQGIRDFAALIEDSAKGGRS